VKLIEKHSLKSLSEMKSELEDKIGKDDRSRLITASLNEKLRKKYTIKKDLKQYAKIQKQLTIAIMIINGNYQKTKLIFQQHY